MFTITPALQDYLESIWIINREKKIVRVKDVAKFLRVKAPSVIEALSILKEKGLIDHERYGLIELTQRGKDLAKRLYERHNILKKFFTKVLGIDERTAESDACKIEHYLSKQTLERVVEFIKFIETCPVSPPEWLNNFYYFAKHKKRPQECPAKFFKGYPQDMGLKRLSDLKLGQKAKVVKIIDTGVLKRRLLDMGFVKGEIVEIKKVAPLGSPIDVLVKGAHLSLRKEEAEKIIVELLE